MIYGVTDKGFVLKRLDSILDEIHSELSEGFSFDTQQDPQSFLNVLVTSFGGQVADLWEVAQSHYYAKYPTTAEGVNLDNAAQYGGIRRARNRPSYYYLHCSGEDGTYVREGTTVCSNTLPKVNLLATSGFTISRSAFNGVKIRVVTEEVKSIYTISLQGNQYSYTYDGSGGAEAILSGLAKEMYDSGYMISFDKETVCLEIIDSSSSRNSNIILSENLTTREVTTVAYFQTEEYGKVVLPSGTVTEIVTSIRGFHSVVNILDPIYGRAQETDIEFRQSYLAKSAIRSSRMLDSITSQLINNVAGIESASAYENETDKTDAEGRPPHSIEVVVEGGAELDIAEVILDKKAGGIQTFGSIEVQVPGKYGDLIPIRFNRPEYIYVWIQVSLYGNQSMLPSNYASLVIDSINQYGQKMKAGDSLLSQLLNEGIYSTVAGLTYIDINIATSLDVSYIPNEKDYYYTNVAAASRQKILISENRIGVVYSGNFK